MTQREWSAQVAVDILAAHPKRNRVELFMIIARAWHHARLEEKRAPKLKLKVVGASFNIPEAEVERLCSLASRDVTRAHRVDPSRSYGIQGKVHEYVIDHDGEVKRVKG